MKYMYAKHTSSNRECYLLACSALLRRKNPFNLAEADCTSVGTAISSAFSATYVNFNDVIVQI